jgi:hypothetical protein
MRVLGNGDSAAAVNEWKPPQKVRRQISSMLSISSIYLTLVNRYIFFKPLVLSFDIAPSFGILQKMSGIGVKFYAFV